MVDIIAKKNLYNFNQFYGIDKKDTVTGFLKNRSRVSWVMTEYSLLHSYGAAGALPFYSHILEVRDECFTYLVIASTRSELPLQSTTKGPKKERQ